MPCAGALGLCALMLLQALAAGAAPPPVVSNVHTAQRPGTQLVDAIYDLANPGGGTLTVRVAVGGQEI